MKARIYSLEPVMESPLLVRTEIDGVTMLLHTVESMGDSLLNIYQEGDDLKTIN